MGLKQAEYRAYQRPGPEFQMYPYVVEANSPRCGTLYVRGSRRTLVGLKLKKRMSKFEQKNEDGVPVKLVRGYATKLWMAASEVDIRIEQLKQKGGVYDGRLCTI